jgi:hypothetical protein
MFIKSLRIIFGAALAIALSRAAAPEAFAVSVLNGGELILVPDAKEESKFTGAIPGGIELTFISVTKRTFPTLIYR